MLDLLKKLREIGYTITLDGDSLRLLWTGNGKPDPATVKPILNELKARKAEAVAYLQRETVDYPAETDKARRLLREQGWCVVESKVLGETVIWTRDGKVAIPERWQNNAVYTLGEIAALAAEPRVTADGLRRVHEAKRIFSGTVCGANEP